MAPSNVRYPHCPLPYEEHERRQSAYMGSYMPFAGVRYYALLDDQDIAKKERRRIGRVGWRLPEASASEEAQPSDRALVAV